MNMLPAHDDDELPPIIGERFRDVLEGMLREAAEEGCEIVPDPA